jgi:polyhydroxyalkanoate synthesis regulator phasin
MMTKDELRNQAAKIFYEADINLSENTSVKELIDVMVRYGELAAREYYRKGVSDALLNRVDETLLR